MPVNVETEVNLETKKVKEFLRGTDSVFKSSVDADFLKLLDLELKAEYDFQVPPEISEVYTAIRRHYKIIKNRTLVARTTAIIPEKHTVEIRLIANLLLKSNLDDKIKSAIENAFNDFDPRKTSDIQKYAHDFINKSKLSITNDDYYLLYTFHLTKVPPVIQLREQVDALKSRFREGELVHDRDEYLDLVPSDPPNEDGVIKVPDTDNRGDIEERINQEIENEIENSPCSKQEYFTKRIEQIGWFPEFRTQRKCKNKWLCCVKTRICYEKLETREARVILYASLVYSWDDRRFRNTVFEHCLVNSATSATIIGIVLENFPAAVYAFQVLFLECIKELALEDLECLLPNLYLITQRSKWDAV